MKNKKLEKLLEELNEELTSKDKIAAEPVATEEKKPEELQPSVENKDILPADEHKEAEEVKEVVIESDRIYTKEELMSLFESLDIDTHKYTFDYIAEELEFEELFSGSDQTEIDAPALENDDVFSDEEHDEYEDVDEIIVESPSVSEAVKLIEEMDALSNFDFVNKLSEMSYEDLVRLDEASELVESLGTLNEGIFRGTSYDDLKKIGREEKKSIKTGLHAKRREVIRKLRSERRTEYKEKQKRLKAVKDNKATSATDFDKKRAAVQAANRERLAVGKKYRLNKKAENKKLNLRKDELLKSAKQKTKKAIKVDSQETSVIGKASSKVKEIVSRIKDKVKQKSEKKEEAKSLYDDKPVVKKKKPIEKVDEAPKQEVKGKPEAVPVSKESYDIYLDIAALSLNEKEELFKELTLDEVNTLIEIEDENK